MSIDLKKSMLSMESGGILLLVLLMLYCLVGLTGSDPSKQGEGYIFGIILEFWRGGSWLIPKLAGEPFMEKPPLYYLVGSAFAHAFSSWLPLCDAARLSSGFFTAVSALVLAVAGRLLWGEGYGRFVVLALFSSLGLLIPSHMMLTDNAQLTGICLGLLGLAATIKNRWWSHFILGSGVGVAFLAKGLLGPALIGSTALLLLVFPNWRTQSYFRALGLAFVCALPYLFIWPILVYRASPSLFADWFWQNNVGRFLGFAPASLNAVHQSDLWYSVLPWATFPILPIVIVFLFLRRQTIFSQPAVQLSLVFSATVVLLLLFSASIRAIYALPLLPALALLAAPFYKNPPLWITRGLEYLSCAIGAIFIFISWWFWGALALGYQLPFQTVLEPILTPDLKMPIHWGAAIVALMFSLVWLVCQLRWRSAPWRGLAKWYVSVLTILAIISTLWIPWVSAEKSSYRPVFQEIGKQLPKNDCVSSIGLGESQRGMFDYVLNIQTHREDNKEGFVCNTLLVDGSLRQPMLPLKEHWRLVWSGMRASDSHEKFWLFARSSG